MSAYPPPAQPPPGGVPGRPDAEPQPKIPGPAAVKMTIGFLVALVVAVALPHLGGTGSRTPPVGILVSVGALIAAVTMCALWFALRRDIGLPQRTVLYAAGYLTLVVVVKFVLAPIGVYQVDRKVPIQTPIPLNTTFGLVLAAGLVLLLYLLVYWLIYRPYKRRFVAADPAKRRRLVAAGMAFPAIVAALLVAGTGGAFILWPLLVVGNGASYLQILFGSSVAFLIVLCLVAASALAIMAFRSAADRAQVVGDASVLVAFFWLGLFFLVLFHVLWVVYLLVLFSLWPLKVIVPK